MSDKNKKTRKHYLDNIRNIIILLLFPGHAFMIWNNFNTSFYIWQGESEILSGLVVLGNPWFMPILFVIAGISARLALKKRSIKVFIKERTQKLLIPFISGMILLVPFQTLYARKFHYNYQGGYFENLGYFFTHVTDFTGFDGCFTPGHLWFILFLYVISLVSLIIIYFVPYVKVKSKIEKLPLWGIILCFVPVWLLSYVGNFSGFSVGKNFALFLLGYYVISSDKIMDKLQQHIKILFVLQLLASTLLMVLHYTTGNYGNILFTLTGWIVILFILAAARKYLNKKTWFTSYFNKSSYPIYILHESILIVLAYYIVKSTDIFIIQFLGIMIGSFILTELAYHLLYYIPFVRKLFGIYKKKKNII